MKRGVKRMTAFDSQFLEKIKKKLTVQRQSIFREVEVADDERRSLEATTHPDVADEAASVREQTILGQLGEVERRVITRIDNALARISRGDYGECDDCGEIIPKGRLDAEPTANRCVNCQQDYEREYAQQRPPEAEEI